MERLQKSMNGYVKTLSKRQEGDDKEKILPVAYSGLNNGESWRRFRGGLRLWTVPAKYRLH